LDDKRIIALFFARDQQAVREFERSHRRLCLSIASSITGDEGTAEECFNDTCLKLWETIPPKHPFSLAAYAGRIIRNLALNRLAESRTAKRSAILVELDSCITEEVPELEEGEIGRLIDEFLSGQSELCARLFVRRYWYSDSVANAAEFVGISENKASKLLGKMRKELKEFLTGKGVCI